MPRIHRGLIAASAGAVGLTALAVPAQADVSRSLEESFSTLAQQTSSRGFADGSAMRQGGANVLPEKGIGTRSLVQDPESLVLDVETDAIGDSWAYGDLSAAGLMVLKDDPDLMLAVGTTEGPTARQDGFGVLFDTNGDGQADYGAMTGDYMSVGTAYRVPLGRLVGSDVVDTGRSVTVMREAYGYVMGLDNWRGAGFSRVSYVVGIGAGDNWDFAPEQFGAPIRVGDMVPSAGPAVRIPSKVSGLSAKAGRKQAKIKWSATAGATSYRVKVKKSRSHKSWQATGRTIAKIKGLKPGRRYKVLIRANNSAGSGAVAKRAFRTKG